MKKFAFFGLLALTAGSMGEVLEHPELPLKNLPLEMHHRILGVEHTEQTLCQSEFTPVDVNGMYAAHRDSVVSQMQTQVNNDNAVVFVVGLKEETRSGSDAGLQFRQDSRYWYLTGIDFPDTSMLVDLSSGRTVLFVPKYSSSHIIYNGDIPSFEEISDLSGIPEIEYSTEVNRIIDELGVQKIYTMDESRLLESFPQFSSKDIDGKVLDSVVYDARKPKTDKEVALIYAASRISGTAHNIIMQNTEAGMLESDLESRFLHECYNCGLRLQAYISIVGAGKNGAVLHYIDNDAEVQEKDMILVDAGGEYYGYATDITRTYPASGRFSESQRIIYDIVLAGQEEAIKVLKVGTPYSEAQRTAERVMTDLLVEKGFFLTTYENALEKRLLSTFLPHGIGHGVGLDVHDPYSTSNPLLEHEVWTVEPGIYFIDGLLDTARNGLNRDLYNWELIDQYLDFGGVRIEDVVLVTHDGPVILSDNSPKTIPELETLMNGKSFQDTPRLRGFA